jgi:hypothetical protein
MSAGRGLAIGARRSSAAIEALDQGPGRLVEWHYLFHYFNTDGPSLRLEGRSSPRQLVRFMARRPGVCCGVNWFIDRDARVFRLAPLNARLRHNPPRGHGEMRDAYLARNPSAPWGARDDFDAPAAAALRQKIRRFLSDRAASG